MPTYMLSVHGTGENPYATDEEMEQAFADVDAWNQELQSSGHWVFAGGLHPIESATTVDATGDEVLVTDGPFAETREHLGGFWVVTAADLDEALALAAKGSAACRGVVEVRPFQGEPED